MDVVPYLIIGVAVVFNFFILRWKFERKRYADVVLDIGLLALLTFLFAGSFGGLVTATVASAIISLYLLAFPPKLPSFSKLVDWW